PGDTGPREETWTPARDPHSSLVDDGGETPRRPGFVRRGAVRDGAGDGRMARLPHVRAAGSCAATGDLGGDGGEREARLREKIALAGNDRISRMSFPGGCD